MNLHTVNNGSHGFGAQKQIALSTHGFFRIKVRGAVYDSLKKPAAPTFDASDLAKKCLLPHQAEGSPLDTGTPAPKLVNNDELVQGLVASYILLARIIQTPNPDTGKREEGLTAYLRSIKDLEAEIIQYATANSRVLLSMYAKAADLKLAKDDPVVVAKAREIQADEAAKFHTAMKPFATEFDRAFAEYCQMEADELLDIIEDAMKNAGVNPWKHFVEGCKRSIDKQRENFSKSNRPVDQGVLTLSQLVV